MGLANQLTGPDPKAIQAIINVPQGGGDDASRRCTTSVQAGWWAPSRDRLMGHAAKTATAHARTVLFRVQSGRKRRALCWQAVALMSMAALERTCQWQDERSEPASRPAWTSSPGRIVTEPEFPGDVAYWHEGPGESRTHAYTSSCKVVCTLRLLSEYGTWPDYSYMQ